MPADTMGNEDEGKIIVDYRGTIKKVAPVESVIPETEGTLVKDAVVAVAGALGGGLIAEAFDAIESIGERKKVAGEVHKWDDKYKEDGYADLSYEELKLVLASRDVKDVEYARKSRQTRYREATSYGVMTGAEPILKSKLVESEWMDYPAKIAEAARAAENEAMGVNEYRYNPRIRGVVADVMGDTELLVRLEGYRNLADPSVVRRAEHLKRLKIKDLEEEIGELENTIKNEVLWNPMPSRYASLVNGETPRQREERLNNERANRQRQHELELEKAKAGAAVRGQGGSGGTNEALRALGEAMKSQREVEVEDDKMLELSEFNEDFLVAHNLPKYIYFQRGYKMIRRDMRTALKLASEVGEFSGLDVGNFLLAYIEEKEKKKGEPLIDKEKQQYTIEGITSFKQLAEGIVPLMSERKRNAGTFASLAGNPKSNNPNVSAGALVVAKFDLKDATNAFEKDEKAKSALAVWLALRGIEVGNLSLLESEFVTIHKSTVDEMMKKNHTELVRDEAVKNMDAIEQEMIRTLKIDQGRANLMRELSILLAEGPEMHEYRKLRTKHRVLWDTAVNPNANKERAAEPVIRKIKHGEVDRNEQGEYIYKIGFGILAKEVKTNGTDGLFTAIKGLNSGDIQGQYIIMRDILDTMDAISDLQAGKDSCSDTSKRREEIAKLAEGLGSGDVPKISKDTVEAIKEMPVYTGKGQLAEAGADFLIRQSAGVLNILEGTGLKRVASIIAKNASVLRKTPQQLLRELFNK